MKWFLPIVFQLLVVNPASACHKYSRWYYPYPQHCRVVTAHVPRKLVDNFIVYPPTDNPTRDYDIPLPDFDGVWTSPMDTPAELELLQEMQRLKALRLLGHDY